MNRTTHTLRNILFDEIEDLRAGRSEPKRAVAVAQLSKQIIGVANVEMRFHQMNRDMSPESKQSAIEMGTMELTSDPKTPAQSVETRRPATNIPGVRPAQPDVKLES